YHELASVFATVDLRDRVRVAPWRALDVKIAPSVDAARGDDLASQAVRALADASGRPALAHVRVRKRIPVASGLGGGSSDLGEVLPAPVDALWIALVLMPTRLSTAAVFAAHRARPYSTERSAKLAKALRDRKATVGVVRESLHNDLLAAAESVAPAIADARKRATALGIDLAM